MRAPEVFIVIPTGLPLQCPVKSILPSVNPDACLSIFPTLPPAMEGAKPEEYTAPAEPLWKEDARHGRSALPLSWRKAEASSGARRPGELGSQVCG